MRKLLVVPVVLVVGMLIAADDKKDDAKADKAKLKGTWEAVTAASGGQERNDGEHTLTFDGDTFTILRKGELMVKGTYKIDPTQKPKTIDFEIKEARRDRDKDKTSKGIYELDGDSLKWCANEPGADERPKEFAAPAGSNTIFITLKREKK